MKINAFIFLLFLFVCNDSFAAENSYDIKPLHSELKLKNNDVEFAPSDLLTIALSLDSLDYKTPSYLGGTPAFEQDFLSVEVGKRSNNTFFNKKGFWEYSIAFKKFARDYGAASQALYLYQLNLFQNFYLPIFNSETFHLSTGVGPSVVYLASEKSVLSNSLSAPGILTSGKITLHYQATLKYQLIISYHVGIGAADSKKILLSTFNVGACFE